LGTQQGEFDANKRNTAVAWTLAGLSMSRVRSATGDAKPSSWQAAYIEVGTTDYDMIGRELPSTQRDDLYPKVVAVGPCVRRVPGHDRPHHPAV
jgi:hypothetical protein